VSFGCDVSKTGTTVSAGVSADAEQSTVCYSRNYSSRIAFCLRDGDATRFGCGPTVEKWRMILGCSDRVSRIWQRVVLISIVGHQRQARKGAWPSEDMLSSGKIRRKSYALRTLPPLGRAQHKTSKDS
jgi:hypothetical protein